MMIDNFKKETEILKFIAQYPFEEIDFGDEGYCQIIGVNYASQEITLRDFCEYTIKEIIETKGFVDQTINKQWVKLINEYLVVNG